MIPASTLLSPTEDFTMPCTLEPIKIEFDGQTYEVQVRAYRSPTGIEIEADLSELRRLLEELEA